MNNNKNNINKPTTGFVQKCDCRVGFYAFIAGLPTFFAATRRECNEWIKGHGCIPVK